MIRKLKKSFSDQKDWWLIGLTIVAFLAVTLMSVFNVSFANSFVPALFALIFMFVLLSWKSVSKQILICSLMILIMGYIFILIAINTSFLLGSYALNDIFGWKLWKAPLLIGLFWFLITFSAWQIANIKYKNWLEKTLVASLLMVMFWVIFDQFSSVLGVISLVKPLVSSPIVGYILWLATVILTFSFYHWQLKKFDSNLYTVSILPMTSIWLWLLLLIG